MDAKRAAAGQIVLIVDDEPLQRMAVADMLYDAGFWTLEAGIFPENRASVALHCACGFELVGVRRRVGQMADGRWRDVALYERRSTVVGAD